jgi:hypothetical protein
MVICLKRISHMKKDFNTCIQLQKNTELQLVANGGGTTHMQNKVIRVIAENIDTIINIYKMSEEKDRREIEQHIRSAIQNIQDSEKI